MKSDGMKFKFLLLINLCSERPLHSIRENGDFPQCGTSPFFSLYSSILAMTENAFTEDVEKSKEAGMDEHLSKPVDIAVLERAVRKYLVTPENERPSTEIYPVSP